MDERVLEGVHRILAFDVEVVAFVAQRVDHDDVDAICLGVPQELDVDAIACAAAEFPVTVRFVIRGVGLHALNHRCRRTLRHR